MYIPWWILIVIFYFTLKGISGNKECAREHIDDCEICEEIHSEQEH